MQTVVRVSSSFFLASGVTCLLFWLMQALIVVETRIDDRVAPLPKLDFVKVRIDEKRTPPKATTPPLRRVIEAAPPIDPRVGDPAEGIEVQGRSAFDPGEGAKGEDPVDGFAAADGDAIPFLRVEPAYPEQALARGLEGRVLVEFDITEAGTVENARVVAFEPTPVFNEAALRAVRQWRYNPKVANGRAVRQLGLRIAIPFRRDETSSSGSSPR